MASIIEFPSQRAQGLAFLDQQVRRLLAERGADKALIDFAAETTRRVYERSVEAENYSFSVTLPESISDNDAQALRDSIREGVERIRDENHAVLVRLIAELVMAEVRMFQASRDIPMLLLRGASSDILAPDCVAKMHENHPGMAFAEIPNRGHAPTLTEAESLSSIDAFLRAL